jgi:hypothetical protein
MERESDAPKPSRVGIELNLQRLLVSLKYLALGPGIEAEQEGKCSIRGLF